MIRLGNNEVLKTLTKTLTFVDADANAGGSTIALPERCSGELIKNNENLLFFKNEIFLTKNVKIQRLHAIKATLFTRNIGTPLKCQENMHLKMLSVYAAEYSCKLFKPIFAYRQTVWTLLRMLLEEQSDLGPHCLQK